MIGANKSTDNLALQQRELFLCKTAKK